MFIGRKKELAVLEQAYHSQESALIPIYGRRRVGKSELILRFLKDKLGLYYLGKKAPAQLQIREFLREAARVLEEPLLSSLSAENWLDVFTAIAERFPKDKKFILVFDEFQWAAEAAPELLSTLQEFWDRRWKRSANIMIILCGSYIGFMERAVLGRKSSLFGRRTAQILLRPFPYTEAAGFHPRWSLSSKAMVYFICGGIPLYFNFFNPVHSVEKNKESVPPSRWVSTGIRRFKSMWLVCEMITGPIWLSANGVKSDRKNSLLQNLTEKFPPIPTLATRPLAAGFF